MTFFDGYSYRQKNLALLVLGVLLIAVSYKRAFRISIETYRYLQELTVKQQEAVVSSRDIQSIQVEIATLNKLLGNENVALEEVQQGFLNFIAKYGTGVDVQEMEEVYAFDHPDFRINTFKINIKGPFLSQLRFIYSLERKFNDAQLIHANTFFRKNLDLDKDELITTLLLQNYVQNKQ